VFTPVAICLSCSHQSLFVCRVHTSRYSETNKCNPQPTVSTLILPAHLHLSLPNGLVSKQKVLYAFIFSALRATCSAYLMTLNAYTLCSSALCHFLQLLPPSSKHPPSLFSPQQFLLFSHLNTITSTPLSDS